MAAITIMIIFFITGCNNGATSKENIHTIKAENATASDSVVTNPLFKIAPVEYAALSEQALLHLAKFEFDAWGQMLADDVVYSFPDGDEHTRTSLSGKATVISWWKNWKEKSGIESMTLSAFNHVPINVTEQPKGGFPTGIYDIVYFSNTMMFNGKPVSLRMNFSVHFNSEKKIDHYATYYDRSIIIKAMGKDILNEKNNKK